MSTEAAPLSSRFPLVQPDAMTPEQVTLYEEITAPPRADGPFRILNDDGSLAGPFNALLQSPAIGHAVQTLGTAIRFGGKLPGRTRELVICFVAVALDAGYEWYAHSRVALTAGITPQELDQIRAGAVPDDASDVDTAALLLARGLIAEARITDQLHARALEHLGHGGITELTILVGYYRTLAGLLAVADVPLPSDAIPMERREHR